MSDAGKVSSLQESHAWAYARDAALRGMLFDLKSRDVVRIIEGAGNGVEAIVHREEAGFQD